MSGVISVNQPILEDLNALRERNNIVIYNGFEADLFKNVKPSIGAKFRIIILGALYPTQDIKFMLEGFNRFLSDKSESEVEVLFIGLKYFQELASYIEAELPNKKIMITDRVPREEGLQLLLGSHVLYYIGWKGFRGMYSGKIFEYLGARKNILIAPSDEDVLEKLIHETNSGKVADSPKEMADNLNEWFAEWKQNGHLKYYGKEEKINKYTRSYQAEKLAKYINSLLNEK
jgi:glycosyltransferase involved in cell wall biosynthesis